MEIFDHLLVLILLILALGSMALGLAGAFIYDISQLKKQRYLENRKNTRQFRERPLISIIVLVENQELNLYRCLQSIIKSNYRKYEIIIFDNCSKDKSKKIANTFKASYPKKNITIVAKRKKQAMASIFDKIVNKHSKGNLVMHMNADDYLAKNTLKNCANQFLLNPHINVLRLNRIVKNNSSIIGLAQSYDQQVINRFLKLASVIKFLGTNSREGAVRRVELYGNSKKGTSKIHEPSTKSGIFSKTIYASNCVIYIKPVSSYNNLVKNLISNKTNLKNSLMSFSNWKENNQASRVKVIPYLRQNGSTFIESFHISQPIIYSSFALLSLYSGAWSLLTTGWVLLVILLFFTIINNEQLTYTEKMRLGVHVPIVYLLFCIMGILEIFASIAYMVLSTYRRAINVARQANLLKTMKV